MYGSIAGTVTDSSGARAPGASLTITSLDRGTVDTVTSNSSGYYLKDRLLPGRYELKAELKGFKTQVVAPVVVGVDAQTKVDPVLQPGEVTEAVTVTATGGQLLKTDRADVATSFEARQVTDLPMLERNFTRFVLLTPGAQEQPWQHASAENPQGSVQTMVNGQHFSGTGYQLDGTDNRDPILGIIVINPTLESVGEAKVTSQNYDAEFGQAIAGVVSVLTRSGANEFHGSAFEFLQRDQFQARNPFTQFQTDPATGRYIPETKRDQFGGSLGGPIVRNRWFFFADYEGLRSLVGGSRLLNVPTLRARTGDLGDYGVPIFDPATGDPSVRQPFPGNVIPPGSAVAASAQHPLAHPQAQCGRPRQRHAGELRRLRVGDIRRRRLQRSDGWAPREERERLRPLQPRPLHPRRPDRVRRGRGAGPGQPGRLFGGDEPEPRAGPRLHAVALGARRRPVRILPLQGGRAADRLRLRRGRRTRESQT